MIIANCIIAQFFVKNIYQPSPAALTLLGLSLDHNGRKKVVVRSSRSQRKNEIQLLTFDYGLQVFDNFFAEIKFYMMFSFSVVHVVVFVHRQISRV